jgi:hypothetical protein
VKLKGKKGQKSFNQKKKKLEDRIFFLREDMNRKIGGKTLTFFSIINDV